MKLHFLFALALSLNLLACGVEQPIATPPIQSTRISATPAGQFETATVVRAVDGDTIDVLIDGAEYRVRYILVNTPETKHPTKGVEPYGPEASQVNKEMVEGKTVRLEKDVSETDQYGRLLRYVYLDDFMVNEELLRLGLAQVSTFPPDVKYVDRFLAVQREAQETGAGMWESLAGDSTLQIVDLNVYDEYADLQNTGDTAQNLAGWTLVSERGNQRCKLGGSLNPGDTLRVWARAEDAGQGGYNCGFDSGIWSNSNPDPAVLFNPEGAQVSRFE